MAFWKRKPTPEPVAAPEPEIIHIHHIHQNLHTALSHDGWETAGIYHHMLTMAADARWTMIMPDLTVQASDGNEYPMMMSQGIATCPLAVHPAPIGRKHGFVAMAVAAHACAEDWIKEQQ